MCHSFVRNIFQNNDGRQVKKKKKKRPTKETLSYQTTNMDEKSADQIRCVNGKGKIHVTRRKEQCIPSLKNSESNGMLKLLYLRDVRYIVVKT